MIEENVHCSGRGGIKRSRKKLKRGDSWERKDPVVY